MQGLGEPRESGKGCSQDFRGIKGDAEPNQNCQGARKEQQKHNVGFQKNDEHITIK